MNLFGKKRDKMGAARILKQIMSRLTRVRRVAESPPSPAPSAETTPVGAQGAIAKVRDMIETIEKREGHIGRKIADEINKARSLSAVGKKREALQCIKRKKMYEKQLDQIR